MYSPTGFALEIFKKRYALHEEETFEEANDRVARHLASAEKGEKIGEVHSQIANMLNEGLFSFGGRVMYGSGRPRGQLLNCFVVPTADSREGWGQTAKDVLVISGTGGGVGINCSAVRPRGTPIRGSGGTATGAVSLMQIINAIGEQIKAGGGRRTALMLCLDVDHGDVNEFLSAKLDLSQLNNANVSIVFRDNPETFLERAKDKSTHEANVWSKIVSNALKSGEPGILNGYYANKMSNTWYIAPLQSTNPCQPAWATVLTPTGIKTLGDVDNGDTIWSGKRWTKIVKKWSTGIKTVNAYQTTAGTFFGTAQHRVVSNGVKIEAENALTIDQCIGNAEFNVESIRAQDVMDGLMIGDGGVHKASNNLPVLFIGAKDQDYLTSEVSSLLKKKRPGINECAWEVFSTVTADELTRTYERIIPDRFRFGNPNQVRGFLRGLYSANGSVAGERVALKQTSFMLVLQVQEMLSSLGIPSYYTTNKTRSNLFPNGEYTMKQSYDLNITNGRQRFAKLVGFIQQYKTEALNEVCQIKSSNQKVSYDIKEKREVGVEEVFDITVDDPDHTYWTGGLLVSNCGEIWLSPYDCCCLGALVLPRFVNSDPEPAINWSQLEAVVHIGVRALDNVLTVNHYPLPEIQETCSGLRRIGLGVMGLHDMLLEMGLRYNSDEGIELVNKVMKFIKNAAYEASIKLAEEKGAFPKFDADKFLKSGFVRTLKPSIRSAIKKHGIRNCALLTIAPTGTTSMTQSVSSGIEPMFAPAYERRYHDGGTEIKTEVVVHPLFKRFVEEGRSVEHFQGAHELSMRDHFEMQRICQVHLDNACSKTVNVPQGTSAEELSGLYQEYLPHLKGVTVYPEGSRENQPLTPISLEAALTHVQSAKLEAYSKDSCRIDGQCG